MSPAPRCFVVGHPIAHSRSPFIHGHWLARYGLAGSYERVDVAPEALADFIRSIRAGAFSGGNVTVPHKVAIMPLLDAITPAARAIGAVNTVWRDAAGQLHGDNTDEAGFLGHLDACVPDWPRRVRSVLVLGAGGAARSILHALAGRGVGMIMLANRHRERAEELAARVGPSVQVLDWEARHGAVPMADMIVNTTPLGMKGQPPLELDLVTLRPGAIVNDIVYVPLETDLLARARAAGATPVGGLGMLLHQAVPGFARWFGVAPEVTPELRDLIEADLKQKG